MAKKIRKGRVALLVLLPVVLAAGGITWFFHSNTDKPARQVPENTEEKQAEANAAKLKQEASAKIKALKETTAGEEVDLSSLTTSQIHQLFYQQDVSDDLIASMEGVTYVSDQDFIQPSDLALVRVVYKNYEGKDCIGELIVNRSIAQDTQEIFQELYDIGYPIHEIVLPDVYDGDDNLSMAQNNTSAFSFRLSDGVGVARHEHSLGLAIDLNPLQNPQVIDNDGEQLVFPYLGREYADRSQVQDHMITHEDPAYEIFTKHGFTWGGDWDTRQDYMHFEKDYDPSMYKEYGDTASDSQDANADYDENGTHVQEDADTGTDAQ